MFTQVLGMMTLLIVMSQSKEEPFVLFTAKLFLVSEQPFSSTGCHKKRVLSEQKKYLRHDRILPELLSDNLSNVPDDILSHNESDSDRDSVTERKNCAAGKEYSDSETNSDESDSTADKGQPHG
jgi:hypothetical protein